MIWRESKGFLRETRGGWRERQHPLRGTTPFLLERVIKIRTRTVKTDKAGELPF
jgi:hypothetical protein